MKSAIACPVGTSLIKNFVLSSESRNIVDKYRSAGIDSWHSLPPMHEFNRYPDGYLCRLLNGGDVFESLKSFATRLGERSCLELAGIEAIRKFFDVDPHSARVVLYPYRACNSMLCAQVLAKVLREMGYDVEVSSIRPRRGEDLAWFLADLVDKIVRRIASEKNSGKRVFVNIAPLPRAVASFLAIASYLAEANAVVDLDDETSSIVVVPSPLAEVDRDRMGFVARMFVDRECVEYGDIFVSTIGMENLVDYFDRGIIERVGRKVCVSPWAKKVIDVYGVAREGYGAYEYEDYSLL